MVDLYPSLSQTRSTSTSTASSMEVNIKLLLFFFSTQIVGGHRGKWWHPWRLTRGHGGHGDLHGHWEVDPVWIDLPLRVVDPPMGVRVDQWWSTPTWCGRSVQAFKCFFCFFVFFFVFLFFALIIFIFFVVGAGSFFFCSFVLIIIFNLDSKTYVMTFCFSYWTDSKT